MRCAISYDVIVIGAGSAGIIVATRLSENPNCSVLLLEAGPDYPDEAQLPVDIASSLSSATSHDWDYQSVPGRIHRSLPLRRAKLVGGCSATNSAIAIRGPASDYDAWAEQGNSGWSFADVLPAFCRLEQDLDRDAPWHGKDGPISIHRPGLQEVAPLHQAFIEACTSMGNAFIDDHNAPSAVGVGYFPMNAVAGIRQSTALTYLPPARTRPNLTIRASILVDRVLFSGSKAIGVQLAQPVETIMAGHVIIAAGTYGSPAILMRSGIGPADALQALDIPVVENLRGVGQHLIDHPLLRLRFLAPATAIETPAALQTLLTYSSEGTTEQHDLQIFPVGFNTTSDGMGFNMLVSVVKPFSQGTLRLHSRDASVAPLIDPAYFADERDLTRMVEAVRLARHLTHLQPLAAFVASEVYPGPQISDSTADLETAILQAVVPYHHPVGTCKMGPPSDNMAVVNAQGQVHGIQGLSVIDASIMPTVPAANTNLPTMMIAEHCDTWLQKLL